MAQGIYQASEFVFTKLPREWNISALGAGDRWTVTAPDGSPLATIGEPLLKNPVRRVWQAMSSTYPVSDRFHYLEFQAEPDTPMLVLSKLHVRERHSVVWLDGQELGKLSFASSRVEAEKICLRVCDATGASLGEILRSRSPEFPHGNVNYAIHGQDGDQLATLDSVPHGVDHWRGSYRMSITASLSETVHILLLAAALACPYMRL